VAASPAAGALTRRACLLAAALGAGCHTTPVFEGGFREALLPRKEGAGAAEQAPGRVALAVGAAVQASVYEWSTPQARIRMPLGQIVAGALRAALAGAWPGVTPLLAAPPAGYDATLVLEAVRAAHDYEMQWLLPLPVYPFLIGNSDLLARLGFDLSLLDAQGRSVWRRSVDSGRQAYKRPSFLSPETLPDGLLRMAHEQAWALVQPLVAELRAGMAAERMREREL